MSELPKLLYVGDVPVEASYHGSALLYRLLDGYPADRLNIVEAGDFISDLARRLRGAQYHRAQTLGTRLSSLTRTRFSQTAVALQLVCAERFVAPLRALARKIDAEAVLTVAHGYSWLSALRVSRECRIPFHMIVHDDPVSSIGVPPSLRHWLGDKFGTAYAAALSRLCVSPGMEEAYRQRYSAPGSVLYPSQGSSAALPQCSPRSAGQSFVMGYAGSLEVGDYRRAARVIAEVLRDEGAQLFIYGPTSATQLRACGLDLPNVILRGSVPNTEIVNVLCADVDALFLPMSFEAAQRTATELSFPSKLADYTATRLPVLIRAPRYSSAVRWAWENPGVAKVVTDDGEAALRDAITRLRDPSHRVCIANRAAVVGLRMFGLDASRAQFHEAIARRVPAPHAA